MMRMGRLRMHKLNDWLLRLWIYHLTFAAGMLNTAAFLQFAYVTTHHTGSLTQLGMRLGNGQMQLAWTYLVLLGAYMVGAAISGWVFPRDYFRPLKRYGGLLTSLNFGLLVLLWLKADPLITMAYLSLMAGAQNGMILFYRGIVIRTTHVTGTLTDVGLSLGRYLKEKGSHDLFRFFFLAKQLLMFLFGCVTMAYLDSISSANLLKFVIITNLVVILVFILLYLAYSPLEAKLGANTIQRDPDLEG